MGNLLEQVASAKNLSEAEKVSREVTQGMEQLILELRSENFALAKHSPSRLLKNPFGTGATQHS